MTMANDAPLEGPRFEIDLMSQEYPSILKEVHDPPKVLYGIGNAAALQAGVGIIGARKATPYGLSCTRYFASHAAMRGITIISGGARGCDQEAHKAACDAWTPTVVVFGSGADVVYPKSGRKVFEQVIAQGGAVVSECGWGVPPLPYNFRKRNRIIAGLSVMLLVAEAGIPSGTLTTADDALEMGREVAVVPGAITSPYAKGVNHLLRQGATPVVDYESFDDALASAYASHPLFTLQSDEPDPQKARDPLLQKDPILCALCADAYSAQELSAYFGFSPAELGRRLSEYEMQGLVERGRDGRYQACIRAPIAKNLSNDNINNVKDKQ